MQVPSIAFENPPSRVDIYSQNGQVNMTSNNTQTDGNGTYIDVTFSNPCLGATANGLTVNAITNLGGVDYWPVNVTSTGFRLYVSGTIFPGDTYSFTYTQFPW